MSRRFYSSFSHHRLSSTSFSFSTSSSSSSSYTRNVVTVKRPATRCAQQLRMASTLSPTSPSTQADLTVTSISPSTVAPPSSSNVKLNVVSSPFGAASGAPEEFVHRKVRIYHPCSSTTQQKLARQSWSLEFDTTNKWLNPLMGWTSSKDTASQLTNHLKFDTCEQAVAFAEKEGFQYEIVKDHTRKTFKKAYSDRFKWKGFSDEDKQNASKNP